VLHFKAHDLSATLCHTSFRVAKLPLLEGFDISHNKLDMMSWDQHLRDIMMQPLCVSESGSLVFISLTCQHRHGHAFIDNALKNVLYGMLRHSIFSRNRSEKMLQALSKFARFQRLC
jgi:hypothetical protein